MSKNERPAGTEAEKTTEAEVPTSSQTIGNTLVVRSPCSCSVPKKSPRHKVKIVFKEDGSSPNTYSLNVKQSNNFVVIVRDNTPKPFT